MGGSIIGGGNEKFTLNLDGACMSDMLNFFPISLFLGVAPMPSKGDSGIVFRTSLSISLICWLFLSAGFLNGSRPF
jgi:hypothetical protein